MELGRTGFQLTRPIFPLNHVFPILVPFVTFFPLLFHSFLIFFFNFLFFWVKRVSFIIHGTREKPVLGVRSLVGLENMHGLCCNLALNNGIN